MATGRVVIDVERCKGCEICREACPKDVLVLAEDLNTKGYRPVILLDPEHVCTGCALCATVCPDGCITVYRDVPAEKTHKPKPQSVRTAGLPKTADAAGLPVAIPEAAHHG